MNRTAKFFGIVGIILILFGIAAQFLVEYDDFYLVPLHLSLGILFLVLFLLRGGLGSLKSHSLKRKAAFGTSVAIYSLLFILILFFSNFFVSRHEFLHYDSTEQKVFTLADKTQAVLKALKEPVIIRAFYVSKIDAAAEALLNRYAKASENFKWQLIDPEKNPGLMDKYGINQSATLHFSFENQNNTKQAKVVKDITEQEITNALQKLERSSEKVIYALSGHGEGDISAPYENGFLFLSEAIQGENITVKTLDLSAVGSVPADASSLLIIASKKDYLDSERKAIEDYFKNGGNGIFLAEPKASLEIANFLRPLGINVGNDLIVDQILSKYTGPGLGVEPIVASYGVHQITNNFKGETVYKTVSSITKALNTPASADLVELAFTGVNSWAEKNLDQLFSEKPTAVYEESDLKGPVSIAVAFEGEYPKGSFIRESELGNNNQKSANSKKIRIVVFGDSEFVNNSNLRKVYNSDFFLNATNWVMGQGEEIIIATRNFRRTEKILHGSQFNSIFVVSCIIFPELLLIFGLGVWWSRKI